MFYLSEPYKEYAPIIVEALEMAKETGLMDELVLEYWKKDIKETNLAERTIIELKTPQ